MLHDIIVVGAGPVGSTLALAIAGSGLDVVVLDARAEGETLRGDRSLALSHGARLILERLSVWGSLCAIPGAATPITRIDISQAGGFGATELSADEQGVPALGYVVSYLALQTALDAALARSGVELRHGMAVASVGGTPAFAAVALADAETEPLLGRLAAIADGTGASVSGVQRRRHDYGQVAIVAKVWSAIPHGGLAYERFSPEGPMALLPEGDHYGLVWTATPDRAEALQALDDASFLAELARRFGARAGGFTRVGERRAFALAMEIAPVPVGTRCVAIGNAAQTLHPVAGQGFNVGLRDAWELGAIILDSPFDTLGDREMLDRYRNARRTDRIAGIAFTHGLVSVFGNDLPFVRWPRGLALTLLDAVPVAKRAFTRAMLFGLH
ncbi:MAG: FAD-dependent monooxygenase [Betaproteobacteria bacterium]